MKIIPKFAGGASMYTVYQSVQTPQVPNYTSTKNVKDNSDSATIRDTSKEASKKSDEDNTKGKLTEKDLYTMIKDVNGLPNEMKYLINDLKNTMAIDSISSMSSSAGTGMLANAYLSSLYKLKVANQNKEKYEDAIKTAKENGSIGEVAITLSGKLVATDKDGKMTEVSLDEYRQHPDQYQLLTNSNLAWMRKYSPKMAFQSSDSTFEIISNGMGYEGFQKLLDQAKVSLGDYKYSETGIGGKEALLGLKALQQIPDEQKQQYLKGALDGRYNTESSTQTNAEQIKSLVQYLTVSLPQRAKVWASVKTGIADPNAATQALVTQYLSGQLKSDSSYKVTYLGTDEKLLKAGSGSGSGEGGSGSEPKKGFWQQVQDDQGGEITNYTLMVGKGSMSVTGKYYGTTPGMEEGSTSLTKYIGNSKVGYLIKNTRGITFGDQTISPDSFGDVMVNANGGAMVATLPITQDGKVNFSILNTYTSIEQKLRAKGYKPKTKQFEKAKAMILKKVGLGYLVDAQSGMVNPNYFGHFLILEGAASDKAKVINQENKSVALGGSNFIKDASKDDSLFETVQKALSDKDKGKYELDNNWWAFNNNKLYKGNIYIPINNNSLNGANADENEVKVSQAKEYEHNSQRWERTKRDWEKNQNKKSTRADLI